ncbi:MgtC/SapB family protein [Ancylobacter sp. 6x-1]|uniref:Protein MgtC n=1 Tax=Ancylobacter crimeensis TaxID=2579147 RepID=A0ABT0D8G5_9HYPH|nr:MgtC/SapB family protein [Ancylobacter crimeensis]MCK0196235.1 MgtC/SapB family protein [Ancylobacter crimeensis]
MLAWIGADTDALARLAAAAIIGMVIGINRDIRGKPTGMRTLGLVCTGAALVSLTAIRFGDLASHPDATSRVVQGIVQGVLTGIGFLGAGVVIRDNGSLKIHGLTTAATVWMTAALGISCALASWSLIAMGVFITLGLLVVLHPIEKCLESRALLRGAKVAPEPEPPLFAQRPGEPDARQK